MTDGNLRAVGWLAVFIAMPVLAINDDASLEFLSPPAPWGALDATSVESPETDPFSYPVPESEPEPAPDEPGYFDRSLNYLEEQHLNWSSRVDFLARKIDGYFAGDQALWEQNESYVRVKVQEQWIEGGQWEPDNDLKFRLDLPATKDRYRLVIDYRNDETESLEDQTLPSAAAQNNGEDKSFFAGIAGTARDESKRWETKSAAGVKLHIPPDPFVRFDSRRRFALADTWDATFRVGAGWLHSKGFSAHNSYTLDHDLSSNRLFRSTSKLQWLEEEDTLEFAQVLDVFRFLDDRRLLDYQLGALGTSGSNPQINKYYFSTIYRQDLYRQSLYLNLIPEVAYPRERGFEAVVSLTLGFELFFNKF